VTNEFTWGAHETDRDFFERELKSFLPDRIFDAHAHLVRFSDCSDAIRAPWEGICPPEFSLSEYRRYMNALHGAVPTDALCVGIVPNDNCAISNEYVASQVGPDPGCAAHFLVRPADDPEWVRDEVKRLGMCGLKPFHSFVREPISATMQCEIPEYLPEPIMKVADEERWSITIHLVKSRGCADPGNIHWIRKYATDYPNAQLMLCHVARAWNPSHAFEGLPQLADLPNVWICTDLNASAISIAAAFRIFPRDRIVYGSDFWWTHMRGVCAYAGDGFLWIYETNYDFDTNLCADGPTLCGLEHLRAVKWAAWAERLSDREIEDYFSANARRLFGPPGTVTPTGPGSFFA